MIELSYRKTFLRIFGELKHKPQIKPKTSQTLVDRTFGNLIDFYFLIYGLAGSENF